MARTFEGTRDGTGVRTAVVVSRFNEFITGRLLDGACSALQDLGAAAPDIVWVPGAFEIPLAARAAALTGRYDAVICLGAVIRGETAHFEHVGGQAAHGIAAVGLETGLPVVFGVLTTDNVQQALDRAGAAGSPAQGEPAAVPQKRKTDNKGYEAALTAVEMVSLLRGLRS